jgi:hypothetical protein
MWEQHLKNLLRIARDRALRVGGSSLVGVIVVGLLAILAGFVVTAGIEWYRGGRTMSSLRNALKSWPPYVGSFVGLLLCWGGIYIWAVAATVYQDHQSLVNANIALLRKSEANIPSVSPRSNARGTGNHRGKIDQYSTGDCSPNNIGSNNTTNCNNQPRITASRQKQRETGDPDVPWETSFTITTTALVQTGDLRLKCSGPVLKAGVSRINSSSLSTGNNGPDVSDSRTAVYELGPEMLSPGKIVTIAVYSKKPITVVSGTIGEQQIIF